MANSASSSLLPLLESLEDSSAGQTEQTDAYLTITSRLSGEDGCNFLPAVVKHFPRLGKVFQTHILCQNSELSQAALQALGFCVFHSSVVSGIPANIAEELLKSLTSLVVTVKDKNTCTRALWVISKQNFPVEVIAKQVPDILKTLETVQAREDIQSVVIGHEALNVVIRLLEQTPVEMGEAAVQWAKLVIPLVVHPASKVRLRAAAALEMGMPLLLKKQQEVATIIEPLMSSKLIPELQKLFSSKNESNVLKLWPLFVRLLGKLLHRGGPFINSLLHLEELGFRSSSPIIKKIAFIAWKSLIDNFALNPEILCSAKRLKLLMQPLSSIQVRTEALLLTKLEVWWYLVVKLGANLAANFEQVGVPLLQSAINVDSHAQTPATPARNANTSVGSSTPKAGGLALNSPGSAPRMNLNSSLHGQQAFPAIQLLGLEMLLHYFLGAEVTVAAAKHKLQLSLEPLGFPLLASPSSFNKFSSVLFTAVRDGFINVGKDAPDALLILIWNNLIGLVTVATETAGSKKERQGSEVLALLLQTLQSIVLSETLPADRTLVLLEATVKRLPQKILGSAAYQVANMDVLNGTPALFLFLLFFNNHLLPSFVSEERFFLCMETLVSCGLSGPTSSLAFSESALGIIGRTAELVENKELLWRMWSIVVNPLTDTIMQTNEVNQGDALEHNFTAVYSALIFPFSHFLSSPPLPQITQKSLLTTWSRLYKTFARCSALVATAEENVCCEELCCKIIAAVDQKFLSNLSTLDTVANILLVIIECVDFSPYTSKFQQKIKSPHTPLSWGRKKNRALGNLASFQTLLVLSLDALLSQGTKEMVAENTAVSVAGLASILLAVLTILFSNLAVPTATQEILSAVSNPLAMLFELSGRPQNEQPAFLTSLGPKLEKLLGEMLACLQTRAVMAYDSELLVLLTPLLRVLLPHRSKQMRTLVTQFWNGTFANATVLTYPEELKPILSQVKQKTLIILPGFQAVHLSGDYSGPDSGESSQLETKISGVTVTSAGKRDSLLSRAGQIREKMSSKPVSVKLDFGSPKLPRRELLEEEASLDFVFIPPETKERVLTEHQKEVKRTKRTDIPAMYNNLDASLDTTMFSQYTQSQDELMDKVSADDKADDAPVNELHVQAEQEQMDTEGSTQEAIEDGACNEETLAGVVNTSMQNSSLEAMEGNNSDFNASASSDMVSGTPQKPTSRRQSFITLEKYEERKTASPMTNTRFTGLPAGIPEGQTNNSQPFNTETMQDNAVNKKTLQVVIGPNLSLPNKDDQQNESVGQAEQEQVVRSEGENSSQDIEDKDGIIPNTQIDTPEAGSNLRDAKECTPPEEHPKSPPSDSQNSQISPSPLEVRRSGRRRSRPVRPGESREEVEEQQTLGAASKAGELMNRANAQTEVLSQGRATRSKTAVEGLTLEGKNRMSGRPSTAHRRHSQSDSQSVPLVLNLKDIKLQDGVIRKGRVMVDKDLRSPKTPIKEMKISTRNSQKAALLSPEPDVLPQGGPGKRNKVASALNKEMSHEEHSQESLQGPARYRTRRSSQGLLSSTENSESEGSESREENQTAKKRGRKPKVALTPSLLRNEGEQPDGVGQVGSQLQAEVESSELAEGSQSRTAVYEALGPSESLQNDLKFPKTTASDVSVKAPLERNAELVESTTVVKECVVLENTENKDSKLAVHEGCTELVEAASKSEVGHICPHAKRGQELQCTNGCHCKVAGAIAQDTDSADSQNTMGLREGVTSEDCLKPLVSLDSVPLQPGLASPQAVDSSTDDAVFETSTLLTPSGSDTSVISTVQTKESDLSVHKGESQEMLGIVDKFAKGTHDHDFQTEVVCDTEENVPGWELVEEHREALQEAQKQNGDESVASVLEESSVVSGEGEHTQIHDAASASLCQEPSVFPEDSVCVDSPPKQKILDAPSSLADAGQSPSRGKTRGVWSPSASPSTSILKKGQKRLLEEESSSPLLKSRRVSFADPIHHQELADDIDRRSPVIRSSSSNSPRSKNSAPSAQQKFAATPTKGLQTLSPRNLCSPGYRSSKKCLISEMSQEPKPIPKDCVYPALVGCSVPVEAILPQLTSNMWPRGFGQLVRARNIKTIGDLSALAPSEIKSLPIRSPKLSNVKKALKTYHEQQRKGRDELKAFDVMEKMTSEPEETEVSQSLVEGNVSLKVIETELSVVPLVADQKSSDLPSAVEALALHLTPEELGHCSPGQLVKMHEQLSNMMRRIVAQLQSRLPCGTNDS